MQIYCQHVMGSDDQFLQLYYGTLVFMRIGRLEFCIFYNVSQETYFKNFIYETFCGPRHVRHLE